MTQTTSSPKNYNLLALRGSPVDDMEYIEAFGLDPNLAYTPALNDAMLQRVYDENIAEGIDEQTARHKRKEAEQDVKKLLASNGMLK